MIKLFWPLYRFAVRRFARADPDRFGLWCERHGFDPDVVRSRVGA